MSGRLEISTGQHSDKGRKEINQDFHGIYVPKEPQLSSKGIAIALADGISSSDVSQVASEAAVSGFLEDYICTSDTWSVKKSAQRVLMATNSWLHAQTRRSLHRYDRDTGYVCTLSVMVIKSTTAHIFHVGDARIYRLRHNFLEQLTNDHRVRVSTDKSYLSRALGINPHLEIDYQALQARKGDVFLFVTDGVYEHVDPHFMINAVKEHENDLDNAARAIVAEAYQQGSADNLTTQIVRVDDLPDPDSNEIYQQLSELPFPPTLEARRIIDGYTIVRKVHVSNRSHVYLATDAETNAPVIIKAPSTDLKNDASYLERLYLEEWIARRINSPHVLRPYARARRRSYLYVAMEFIDGQTLTHWMRDNPKPDWQTVRAIVEQIAKGLQTFHRMEMLHQDVRPDNIMIDATGTVKIIDFGSTKVAGIMEVSTPIERSSVLGTAQYIAPEYLLGKSGSPRSDIFSLGVVAYQMLTGKLPYGTQVAKTRTRSEQKKLRYDSMLNSDPRLPIWIDEAIKKAVHPDPQQRYEALSEFVHDLNHPNKAFLSTKPPPLLERDPLAFWKGLSFILAIIIVFVLLRL